MNNLILDSVDNLVNFIKSSQDYKDYIFLREKLLNNKKTKDYINKIKSLQKQIVKKEVNGEDIMGLNNKINDLLIELNKIPLYNDFIAKQRELDELYQYIKSTLDDYFNNILN